MVVEELCVERLFYTVIVVKSNKLRQITKPLSYKTLFLFMTRRR